MNRSIILIGLFHRKVASTYQIESQHCLTIERYNFQYVGAVTSYNAISDYYLKEAIWPNSYDSSGTRINSTFFEMAKTFMSKAIIVRLKYKDAEVELTKLDVRTTTTAKIANFGGTFGIWSELTGCSLLGIINLIIITFKVLLRARK